MTAPMCLLQCLSFWIKIKYIAASWKSSAALRMEGNCTCEFLVCVPVLPMVSKQGQQTELLLGNLI